MAAAKKQEENGGTVDFDTAQPRLDESADKLLQQFRAARRAGTPLLAIETADPAATIDRLTEALNGKANVLQWDVVRGVICVPGRATEVTKKLASPNSKDPMAALACMEALPPKTVLFAINMQLYWSDGRDVVQGTWNLRDVLKRDKRTLVIIGASIKLPDTLKHDVVLLEEPAPTDEQFEEHLSKVLAAARSKTPSFAWGKEKGQIERAVTAVRGLPLYAAETAWFMALKGAEDGSGFESLDLDELLERSRRSIEQVEGLTVYRGKATLDRMGGLYRLKNFSKRVFEGAKRPRLVLRVEEGEKTFAGTEGDRSGTSADQLSVVLTTMEDFGWTGIIAVGGPGTGKSEYSKTLGATYQVPTITADLGAMKGEGLVGQAEKAIRAPMRVIRGIGGDAVFVIMSCNKITSLPPELKRRFWAGTWYFDMPTREELDAIWPIQLKSFGLPLKMERPSDINWTGSDVRNVCSLAWQLKCSLVEAATYIVPVYESDPASIEALRAAADGHWLSTTYEGAYDRSRSTTTSDDHKGLRDL